MTDPSNPSYQIAQSNPEPQVPPEHDFVAPESGALLPCWYAVMTLESGHVVHCGLKRSAHKRREGHNLLWDRSDSP